MKMREELKKTGYIPTFSLKGELETLKKLPKNKPSTRILYQKNKAKILKALDDIESQHNHSWYCELRNRAETDLDALALFYRGTKISFRDMFKKADELAKSFAKAGVRCGDEIPVCLSNVPETVYIMLALNKLGAKMNSFGAHYVSEYVEAILQKCSKKIFIGTDDSFEGIKGLVNKVGYEHIAVISLTDSLPELPEQAEEYEAELTDYYRFENKVNVLKKENSAIKSFSDFLRYGSDYGSEIVDENDLDREFLITYTSGSTKIGYPKAIIHTNRSMITMGMFHDPELSGNPKIKGLRGLAIVHPDSNTDLVTCISDNLMQLWSVALEPEYCVEHALDYLMLNKPNYANMTVAFWLEAGKQYLLDGRYRTGRRKLPFLLAAFVVGEKLSSGEEWFINRFLKEAKAGSGVKILGLSLPYVTVSTGGGDCEHGGIYYSLWKTLQEKLHFIQLKGQEYGLMPVPYVQISAFKLRADGLYEECDYNQYGILAANSVTTMKGYKNNPEATERMLIRDVQGRDWVSCNVHGYIDRIGGVHVKGRVENCITLAGEEKIPTYQIEDVISADAKNVLSCTVIATQHRGQEVAVVNVQFQPDAKKTEMEIVNSIRQSCAERFSGKLVSKMYYRVFKTREAMPIGGSGKRDVRGLEELGLDGAEKL